MGIDVLTGGKSQLGPAKEILEFLPHEPRLLRPANFPEGNPGSGLICGTAKQWRENNAVLNLQARVHDSESTILSGSRQRTRKNSRSMSPFVFVDMLRKPQRGRSPWAVSGRTLTGGWHAHARGDRHEQVFPQARLYHDVEAGRMRSDRNGPQRHHRKVSNGLPARFEVASATCSELRLDQTDDERPAHAAGGYRAAMKRLRFRID